MVAASESELNQDEATDFIFSMNTWMFSLDADGVNLGYTEVANLADIVTVPLGALYGIIKNMAIISAPDYGVIVKPALAAEAIAGLKVMRKIGSVMTPSIFPSTLPIGSGNEGTGAFRDNHFYVGDEESILAEASGPIGLEADTEAE